MSQPKFKYDIVREAFLFALEAHANQKYADEYPYILHLHDVTTVLREFDVLDDSIMAAAWLHDVIEDTANNYADVKKKTNEYIADIVYAVTDELGKNRKDRKVKTLPKIDGFPQAQFVKLADWIANVRQGHRNKNKMYKMYKKEFAMLWQFRSQSIDQSMTNMWDELEKLLSLNEKDFMAGTGVYHSEYDE